MKTNKIKNFALVAIAALMSFAVVFAAKHERHNSTANTEKATMYYFFYSGSGTDLTSYKNASNWVQISDPNAPDCSGDSKPCVVQSTQSTVSAFVGSITQTSDVDNNAIRTKD
jgi:hypothetical protein